MTPIDPYWGLIEFVTAIFLVVYFGKTALNVLKVRSATQVKQAKIAQETKNFGGISAMVENHDEILSQLFKIRKEQLDQMNKEGISPDKQALALKPLDQRIKYVETVKNNSWWLQYIAPQADHLIGIALSAFERILKSV